MTMIRFKLFAVISLLFLPLTGGALWADQATSLGPSGNPLPRFVSIKASEAYMRVGPGQQYPIDWVYHAAGLPVEVIGEYGPWRRVRDRNGTAGWMHRSLLSSTRAGVVIGGKRRLYADPDTASRIVIEAQESAFGQILECQNKWCEMDFDGASGWVLRHHIWGLYPKEVFD